MNSIIHLISDYNFFINCFFINKLFTPKNVKLGAIPWENYSQGKVE